MLIPKPDELRNLLAKQGESLKKKLKKLKQKSPKNLDEQFNDLHEEAFEVYDCLSCGNCCKTTSPMLFEKDIERLSSYLKLKPGDFVEKYLFLDTDGIYAMKSTPCPFLDNDNYCSVYDHRKR